MRILTLIILLFSPIYALTNEVCIFEIILKNHRFYPNKIILPKGKRIELIVKNEDLTAEEFESFDLKREKIIPPGGVKKIKIGPLETGEYKFFGEFHETTAQGVIYIKDN